MALIAAMVAHAIIFWYRATDAPKSRAVSFDTTPQTATPAAPPGGINFDSNRYGSPQHATGQRCCTRRDQKANPGPTHNAYRSPNCPDWQLPACTVPAQPMPNVTPPTIRNLSNRATCTGKDSGAILDRAICQQWISKANLCNRGSKSMRRCLNGRLPATTIPTPQTTRSIGRICRTHSARCVSGLPRYRTKWWACLRAADRHALLPTAHSRFGDGNQRRTKLHQSIMAGNNSPLPAQPQPPVGSQTATHPAPIMSNMQRWIMPARCEISTTRSAAIQPRDTVEGLLKAIFSPTEFLFQILIIAIGTFVIIYLIKTR